MVIVFKFCEIISIGKLHHPKCLHEYGLTHQADEYWVAWRTRTSAAYDGYTLASFEPTLLNEVAIRHNRIVSFLKCAYAATALKDKCSNITPPCSFIIPLIL